MNRNRWAALVAAIAAIGAVALGFIVIGGPGHQRKVRADLRTLHALASLAQEINSRWKAQGKTLPAGLDDFPGSVKNNPATGAPFLYRLKPPGQYELCATFATEGSNSEGVAMDARWKHPKGNYCFSFNPWQAVNVPWESPD